MLRELKIENYAIIGHLDIEFHSGLNTITGETGAGKSILLGALSLLGGARADASVIRDGASSCVIEAVFEVLDYRDEMMPIFEANDLDWEDSITVRRIISSAGKSRAFINDIPINLTALRSVADRLVDIHSQHQTLLLAGTGFQTHLVDAVAGQLPLVASYSVHYKQLNGLRTELNRTIASNEEAEKERDYLQHQLDQLLELNIRSGEITELEQEQNILTHADEIAQGLDYCAELMSSDNGPLEGGINSAIKSMVSTLGRLTDKYPAASELEQRIESVYIEMQDIADECEQQRDEIEINPKRLSAVTQRLDDIYSLCQKHRIDENHAEEELLRFQQEMDDKLQGFDHAAETITALKLQISQLEAETLKESEKITKGRRVTAPKIAGHVIDTLTELGIKGGIFEVAITPATKGLTPTGADDVVMLFSGNAGSAAQPIESVASGGEMSRVMLALKGLVAKSIRMPTIIFDEIDSGVSGQVADKMGGIIASMGDYMQVLNITHLPQVASKGEHHYYVYKDTADKSGSGTHIRKLGSEERVEHIASMLSGSSVTEAAITQARELLKRS